MKINTSFKIKTDIISLFEKVMKNFFISILDIYTYKPRRLSVTQFFHA